MSWSSDGVQRERTALAWNRTGLSLLGAAGALLILGSLPGPEDIGALLAAVGGILALRTGRQRAVEKRPLDAVHAEPALLAAVGAAVTLLAAASLWLVLA